MVQLKEGESTSTLSGGCSIDMIKVKNVLQEGKSVINLNHYSIVV